MCVCVFMFSSKLGLLCFVYLASMCLCVFLVIVFGFQ